MDERSGQLNRGAYILKYTKHYWKRILIFMLQHFHELFIKYSHQNISFSFSYICIFTRFSWNIQTKIASWHISSNLVKSQSHKNKNALSELILIYCSVHLLYWGVMYIRTKHLVIFSCFSMHLIVMISYIHR